MAANRLVNIGSSSSRGAGGGARAPNSPAKEEKLLSELLTKVEYDRLKRKGYTYLGKKLGGGTFGQVFAGKRGSRDIAVKRIALASDLILETMADELRILQDLRHPHIVDIYDVFLSDCNGFAHFVMEYALGGDLMDYMIAIHPTLTVEPLVCRFYNQMGDALRYVHSMGIVHQDLKPENVLLDTTKSVLKLTDFGLSMFNFNEYSGTPRRRFATCGTFYYMPPETIRDFHHWFDFGLNPDFDYSHYNLELHDVWGLGMILYKLLIGPYEPYEINHNSYDYVKEQLAAQEACRVRWIVKIPRDTKRFVMRHLEPNPAKRPVMVELMADPWTRNDYRAALVPKKPPPPKRRLI